MPFVPFCVPVIPEGKPAAVRFLRGGSAEMSWKSSRCSTAYTETLDTATVRVMLLTILSFDSEEKNER